MQDCLDVALDVTRSVGFLFQFINEAGRRAGEILDQVDYSPLGDIILARDETYFDDLAFLIGVEPRTYVLLAGQVEEGCDGETWGLSLAFDQARVAISFYHSLCPPPHCHTPMAACSVVEVNR